MTSSELLKNAMKWNHSSRPRQARDAPHAPLKGNIMNSYEYLGSLSGNEYQTFVTEYNTIMKDLNNDDSWWQQQDQEQQWVNEVLERYNAL